MNRIFDFESNKPLELTEVQLMEMAKVKEIKNQILLLRIASLLSMITLAIFALFIVHDSLLISALAIVVLLLYIMGNGVISVIFLKWGMMSEG